jgi:hypothetical protein
MLQKLTLFFTVSAICTLDLVSLMTKSVLAQTRSNTCIQGYVWREATPNDHVCVTPEVRSQTAADNSTATSRIDPVDRTYGSFTCVQGYVWREAIPNDLVCVTPETRSQAKSDNSQASSRRVRLQFRSERALSKTTVIPDQSKLRREQFLGMSTKSHQLALSDALNKTRKFLGILYQDLTLELNYRTIKKDAGFVTENRWVSWVIIEIIANPDYHAKDDCSTPEVSCGELPTKCYFRDPRNCSRRK